MDRDVRRTIFFSLLILMKYIVDCPVLEDGHGGLFHGRPRERRGLLRAEALFH
jgi:hypothetical protein